MTNDPKKSASAVDLTTCEVRLSFPSLDKKKSNGPGSDKSSYQATLLIPPTADLKPFAEAIRAAALAKFGKAEVAGLRLPLRKAEEKEYAGYDKGWRFLATKSDTPVPVVDRQRIAIPAEAIAGTVYAGCWVKARIRFWAYDNKFGKGVSAELKAIQFIRDGERLDGRGKAADPEEVFDALEMEGEKPAPTGGSTDLSSFL